MFVRIYSGILVSTLISLTCCYLAFQYINQLRTTDYTLSLFSGTQQLITAGVNRHSGDKQKQWMALVEKLIGLPIRLSSESDSPLNSRQLSTLAQDNILIEALSDGIHSRIWTQAPNNKLISVKLKNVAEQQLRITAFLILNELGRYPRSKQFDELTRLRQYFHYDINIFIQDKLQLDSQQLSRLQRGDVVLALKKDQHNQDVLMVYSRYKKRNQYLVIGPIAIYNPSPTWLMVTLLIVALSVTGLIVYLLVKNLERRMKVISDVVVNFGPESLHSRVPVSGHDAIGELADGINVMASRIQNLLIDQKDITQAISHELRTPISRMKFRVEILMEGALDTNVPKLQKLNDDIHELDLLVEELLVFQMLDASAQGDTQVLDLAVLIETVIAGIYEPYQAIRLNMLLPSAPVLVEGQENHLKRMVQNLLVNAFKHAKGQVQVSLTSDPAFLQISDDGEGIPSDQRQRIFSPFVRLDSSRNRNTGGFGLGLAIIERIARLHQAQVRVVEAELGGACFEVRFPLMKPLLHSEKNSRRSP